MKIQRRPSVTADVQAARDNLDRHQIDTDSGRCVACGANAPCEIANDAAWYLVQRGCGWPPDPRRAPVPRPPRVERGNPGAGLPVRVGRVRPAW